MRRQRVRVLASRPKRRRMAETPEEQWQRLLQKYWPKRKEVTE